VCLSNTLHINLSPSRKKKFLTNLLEKIIDWVENEIDCENTIIFLPYAMHFLLILNQLSYKQHPVCSTDKISNPDVDLKLLCHP